MGTSFGWSSKGNQAIFRAIFQGYDSGAPTFLHPFCTTLVRLFGPRQTLREGFKAIQCLLQMKTEPKYCNQAEERWEETNMRCNISLSVIPTWVILYYFVTSGLPESDSSKSNFQPIFCSQPCPSIANLSTMQPNPTEKRKETEPWVAFWTNRWPW